MTFHIGKATHLTFMHHRFNIRRSSYKAKNSKLHVVQIAVCIQKRVLCIVIYSFLKKIYEVLAERPILLTHRDYLCTRVSQITQSLL